MDRIQRLFPASAQREQSTLTNRTFCSEMGHPSAVRESDPQSSVSVLPNTVSSLPQNCSLIATVIIILSTFQQCFRLLSHVSNTGSCLDESTLVFVSAI